MAHQLGVVVLILGIQIKIYHELMSIMLKDSVERQLPGFQRFYWLWFAIFAFFMYMYTLQGPLENWHNSTTSPPEVAGGAAPVPPTSLSLYLAPVVRALLDNYTILSFISYALTVVAFVLSLQIKEHFRYQFQNFAFSHMVLLAVVGQSTLYVSVMFKGLIWFVLPVFLIIINDSTAYIFGFLMGRTPLIAISPKKTWEGFIGGAISTFFIALGITHLVTQQLHLYNLKYLFVCPVQRDDFGVDINVCTPDAALYATRPLSTYTTFSDTLTYALGAVGAEQLHFSPMQGHAVVLAIFAALVAPFGGFFASGLKRAFKMKDFGTSIPGHGGFTDRMDCQLIMATFTYVYLYSVILQPTFRDLVSDRLDNMNAHDQQALISHWASAAGLTCTTN
jgi:phosphatidate cytidylyltransferase